MIRVTVWNEFIHERSDPEAAAVYPDGIHSVIKSFLEKNEDITVRTATIDEPECGLTEEILKNTDVLLWWGHIGHGKVPDEIAERVQNEVLKGMGFIALHSGHHSKPFKRLMGTSCNLTWRGHDRERIWCCNPGHPIAKGVPESFVLQNEEMYSEPFGIPNPDDVVFMGWYAGGEVFRSGCTFTRERGRIFYFQPGHETFRAFYNENVIKIITNAVRWAAPVSRTDELVCPGVTDTAESRE